MDRKKITNLDTDDHDLSAVNNITMKNTIQSESISHLKRDALGDVDMKGHFISNHDSDAETDAANLRSVKLLLAGTRGDIGKIKSLLDMNNNKIINVITPVNAYDVTNKAYVDSKTGSLDLSKPLTHDLNMGGFKIDFLSEPTQDNQAATKSYIDVGLAEKVNVSELFSYPTKNYLDSELDKKVNIDGDHMTGILDMGNNRIKGLKSPQLNTDGCSKSLSTLGSLLTKNTLMTKLKIIQYQLI